jgi:hypothetical protein
MDLPKTIAEVLSTTVYGWTVGQPLPRVPGLTSESGVALFLLSQHFYAIEHCLWLNI